MKVLRGSGIDCVELLEEQPDACNFNFNLFGNSSDLWSLLATILKHFHRDSLEHGGYVRTTRSLISDLCPIAASRGSRILIDLWSFPQYLGVGSVQCDATARLWAALLRSNVELVWTRRSLNSANSFSALFSAHETIIFDQFHSILVLPKGQFDSFISEHAEYRDTIFTLTALFILYVLVWYWEKGLVIFTHQWVWTADSLCFLGMSS